VAPGTYGPAIVHFLRSGEWKMKPPFFVPTDTTTLPFLIAPATLTTCNAGENMHDVPGHERHLAEGRHDEFLVHEDVHVGPSRPSFVHDAVADPGERRFEGAQHRVEVRCLEDDLVIAHRPTGGSAVLGLPEVFAKHASILTSHGVPKEAADAAVREMQEEREPRVHAENYDHLPSMARMIGIGLMCIHNPCDEIGRRVMDEALRAQLPEKPRVEDAVAVLESMPEFHSALTRIVVRMGKADHALGKWAVHHGAGTNGGLPVARAAFDHGIDTVFYIHIDAGALRRLWEAYGREGPRNLVVTGHVASDSIGINVLVRELRARGLRVDTYSGIVDV